MFAFMAEQNTERKAFTIKDCRITDIEAFNKLKSESGFTQGKTFEVIIERAFTGIPPVNTEGNQATETEETTNLRLENQRLKADNERLVSENTAFTNEVNLLKEQVNQPPTEIIKEVPVQLTKTQFIVTPSDELANKIRKARPFIKRDGLLTMEDYPGELAVLTVEKFLNNKYADIF